MAVRRFREEVATQERKHAKRRKGAAFRCITGGPVGMRRQTRIRLRVCDPSTQCRAIDVRLHERQPLALVVLVEVPPDLLALRGLDAEALVQRRRPIGAWCSGYRPADFAHLVVRHDHPARFALSPLRT